MKHWNYLCYVLKHKYFVMKECFAMGLFWQGLTHDLSKFTPSEWFAYSDFFFGDRSDEMNVKKFKEAYLLHYIRNPHHHQYWVSLNRDGTLTTVRMSVKYVKEMFCDWVGAGLSITGKRDISEWYDKNKDTMNLHPIAKSHVEYLIKSEGNK